MAVVGGPDDGEGVPEVGGGEADEETQDCRPVNVLNLDWLGIVDPIVFEQSHNILLPHLLYSIHVSRPAHNNSGSICKGEKSEEAVEGKRRRDKKG